ncbi:MAG: radical SAM protein [Deltaproteobacteria bacterium]|nr:radical SAM protein [Deltaproteobacteria bacterium]
MRVVLVHPAGSNWILGKPDITTAANRMPPLGILSMAAYLQGTAHEALVHDCLGPGSPRSPEKNSKRILALNPDLVGFSTTTSAFHDALTMAGFIKQARPEVVIVFGGVHVSSLGAQLLDRFDVIDYLSLGEGEHTLLQLADGDDPATIDGLAWRDGEQSVVNPTRDHIRDLDSLPFPAYDKLPGFPGGYHLPPFSYIRIPGATMITSRGCVYQCSYCDRSVFKRGFRYNSPDYIYDHMRELRQRFGVRHINVYDDLFTTNRKRITALCERLAREPLKLQFNCAVHAGHADDDLLEMLKEAGCLMVSLGIESGDPELLQRHKSSAKLEQMEETVRKIQSHGLRAKGLFMMGLPGETKESIQRTSDFVLSLGLDDMNMSKFTPFPGAPCWDTINEDGTFEEDWQQMNCLNFVFVPKDFEGREELDFLYNTHVKRFYTDPEWRKKFRQRFWQNRHTMLQMLIHLPTILTARSHFQPHNPVAPSNGDTTS